MKWEQTIVSAISQNVIANISKSYIFF